MSGRRLSFCLDRCCLRCVWYHCSVRYDLCEMATSCSCLYFVVLFCLVMLVLSVGIGTGIDAPLCILKPHAYPVAVAAAENNSCPVVCACSGRKGEGQPRHFLRAWFFSFSLCEDSKTFLRSPSCVDHAVGAAHENMVAGLVCWKLVEERKAPTEQRSGCGSSSSAFRA